MKVLFVYPNSTRSLEVPLGIAYLSGMLRSHGYETGLLDLTWNPSLNSIIRSMKGYDLLAVSCGTLEYQISLNIAKIWKKHYDLPIIIGGPHATTVPEEVIKDSNIDAVCIGEAEYALLDFVSQYEVFGIIPTSIKNFWVKRDNEIYRNQLRPLTENLDSLPFPDRSIFDKRHIENKYPGCSFLTSRGCPFKCTSCINHYLQKLYKGLGTYVRFRSIDNLVEEIQEIISSYNVKCILFSDDTFTINHKRLNEFLKRYQKEIGLPFVIMGRCNTVTKDLLIKLRRAGCVQVAYGLESGNDFIRNKVLRRDMSSKQMVDAFRWTREAGIPAVSFNMIGIPFENRNMIFDTIKLNRQVKPNLVQTTLMYPFPKTDIYNIASRNDMLNENPHRQLTEYYTDTIIKLPTLTNHQLKSLRLVMPLYIYLPKLFYPIIRLTEGFLALLADTRLVKVMERAISKFRRAFLERRFWGQLG